MKCMNCGADVPENEITCPYCGQDIQIVPDYNPLDDVLTAQVKGEVYKTLSKNAHEKLSESDFSDTFHYKNNSSRSNTADIRMEERRRKKKIEQKKLLMKKKKQRLITASIASALAFIFIAIAGYNNSYSGTIRKGQKYLSEGNLTEARIKFKKAIRKDGTRAEGYHGMADLLLKEKKVQDAEKMYLKAISKHPDSLELYRGLIDFYLDTDQADKISPLLRTCDNKNILHTLEKYVSKPPKFSLDSDKIYDDIQVLKLTGSGEKIYYTLDGSDPIKDGKQYKETIKLKDEVTTVKAVSINAEGIPSVVVSKTYTIKYPVADAPSVVPTTGQYEEAQQISITVPDGYKAYYTMDGSRPDPGKSGTHLYSGTINMPEGNTVFTAVLVDSRQKFSEMTKRNYELIISE